MKKEEPMASRVNTRFVIILIVGVLALLGMLVLAYSVAYKSPADLAKRGDQFMAEGDYKGAVLAYSKAVNKDSTNVENLHKWVDALEHTTPETETLYRQRFGSDYLGSIKRTATILRNDIDAHERYLKIRMEMLHTRYSRGLADSIIEDSNVALAFFRDDPENVSEWERLKRYRGLTIMEISRRDELLSEDQETLGINDLERALMADPDDVESMIGLINLKSFIANHNASEIQTQERLTPLQEGLDMVNAYLADHPQTMELLIHRVYLQANIDQIQIVDSTPKNQQRAALNENQGKYIDDLNLIGEMLTGSASDQLTIDLVRRYLRLESIITPQARYAQSRPMIDLMIDSQKDNAELLLLAGRVANDAGDQDEAIGWYSQIEDLEPKTLSYQGFRQFDAQREALLSKSKIQTQQAIAAASQTDADQSVVDAAITTAVASRDKYAGSVTDDDLRLIMLDGNIARAKGDLEEAFRKFIRFNELTNRVQPEGLWYEAVVAVELEQYGVARDAFMLMIPLDGTSRKLQAMLTLATIHIQLKDYQAAADLYTSILEYSPGLEIAEKGLSGVNQLLNPDLIEDPVLAKIFEARRVRIGSAEVPGDYAGAIQMLRDSIEEFNYDPRVAQELAGLLLDSQDVTGARAVLEQCIKIHPDNEAIARMIQATSSDDPVDILIASIRLSGADEVSKLLSIARVAGEKDRPEILRETLVELNKIAPNNDQVIEMTFLQMLATGDLEGARAITQRPGLSPVEVLSFRARIANTEGDIATAVELLKQAAASGTADSSIFHMLAILERQTGDIPGAIQSFERSLAISPNRDTTITEYLLTLVRDGQYENALNIARRMQRYGSINPMFMNLWLNLESLYGGTQGQEFAIRQREKMLELNPSNIDNRFQLGRLYNATRQWDKAREIIDALQATANELEFAKLDAAWYASQGTYDGKDGLILANEAFARHIAKLPAPVGAEPYIANAEFMLERGRPDLAIAAASQAIERQTPETMLGSKLLGDLYLRINNSSEAIKNYKAVVDNGADTDFSVRPRLLQAYLMLDRFQDAQDIYNQLPEDKCKSMSIMFQAASIARGLDDSAKANDILNQAVALYPNDASVYITRAEFMVGDPAQMDDLLSDISRAINLDPTNYRAYRVRSAAYFSAERKEDALKDLRTAIKLNPYLDSIIYSVLNEILTDPNRGGEALDIAREVVAQRPDDAGLMTRIGGLFASRKDWSRAAEMYAMAWNTRRSINDGAVYIDMLVRMNPPNAQVANAVITELTNMVGDINQSAGLLAAQALVLQARGRDDFAQQQLTKAFDLSVDDNQDLVTWSGNLSRYFEGKPAQDQVQYLEALKRRNANKDIHAWIDLFIAKHLALQGENSPRVTEILERLQGYSSEPAVQVRAFRTLGSTLFDQGEFEQAAAVWTAGIELFSDDWEMNNNLAYTLSTKLDRVEDALVYGEKAIDENIARSEAYETMAGIYIRLNRYDEAQQMIDAGAVLIKSIPARVSMILTSGKLELARGNMIEARSRLNDAQSTLRASPTAYPPLEIDIADFEQEINSAEG
mgnify:FL=1